MTRKIRLDQIGSFSMEKYEQLLRETVLQTDYRLKYNSPVDTSRLRSAWTVGENSTPGYDPGPQSSVAGIAPLRRSGYNTERAGNVYHIHNSMPYAEAVLYGSNMPPSWNGRWRSRNNQIEKGYPDLIAREMQEWVRRNADAIGRQD